MTDRKPQFKHVNKEADLDELIIGDLVKVDFGTFEAEWETYEGNINGEECFITDGLSEGEVFSRRSTRENLQFEEGTVIFHLRYQRTFHYHDHPNTPEYEKGKELLTQRNLILHE